MGQRGVFDEVALDVKRIPLALRVPWELLDVPPPSEDDVRPDHVVTGGD